VSVEGSYGGGRLSALLTPQIKKNAPATITKPTYQEEHKDDGAHAGKPTDNPDEQDQPLEGKPRLDVIRTAIVTHATISSLIKDSSEPSI
jgi:hypothetical protein